MTSAHRTPGSRGDAGPRLYVRAHVRTLGPDGAFRGGLRVAEGRVTHLFAGEPPDRLDGRVEDLDGATVLPGLVDAHLHLRGLGASARELDLRGLGALETTLEAVRDAAARAPRGTWIRGRGWDQSEWPRGEYPTRACLDAVAPDHPVWLTRVDGHAAWVSTRGLRAAEVTRETPSPFGGEIVRDAGGEPTGILVDLAMELVERALPAPSDAELRADLEEGLRRCARAGLTAVHDMGMEPRVLAVLRRMEDEGAVPVRVEVYLAGEWPAVERLLAAPRGHERLVRVRGVKLLSDGALGSRGAALFAPYADRPDTCGLLLHEPDVLHARVRAVHEAGYQVAVHAIGDRANRLVLDAFEALGPSARGRRHRVEHAQVVAPEDLGRFAGLGVVASMQPTHATSDMGWAEARLGARRLEGAYAARTLLASGAHVAFGTDAPVEAESPWRTLRAAVARRDDRGLPAGGWRVEEAVSVEEALRLCTRDAARAAHADSLGVIACGAPADLTVVDRDPLSVPPVELGALTPLRTIVAGREVCRRG